MARYCLTGSYIALTFPRASPPVTNAALSTAFQADQHLSTDWSDMTTPTSRYCLPAGHLLLLSTLLRFQRDKRKSWVKWQPAFRLVKVVFVVVNRQHRVQNQTVVSVVSVVVKTIGACLCCRKKTSGVKTIRLDRQGFLCPQGYVTNGMKQRVVWTDLK